MQGKHIWLLVPLLLVVVILLAVQLLRTPADRAETSATTAVPLNDKLPPNPNLLIDYSQADLKDIWLAGGCFWGVEAYLDRVPGVAATTVGYANGTTENPTYREVIYNNTGHAETVHVRYDPQQISLEELLQQFMLIIDPTSLNRQGNDSGSQYRTGIYYTDESDLTVIQSVLASEQENHDKPVAVEAKPLVHYYLAEDYHQKYLEKNPGGYCHISFDTLPEFVNPADSPSLIDPTRYTRPADEEIRRMLSDEAYRITQENDTERAFTGLYDKHDLPGLYVDIVTGEPLFLSTDKYDSGSGWPSFTEPIDPAVVREIEDRSYGMLRVEVRSRVGDSHLGHVFTDGPAAAGGLRYCINSAALRFIPIDELEAEGYGYLEQLFG